MECVNMEDTHLEWKSRLTLILTNPPKPYPVKLSDCGLRTESPNRVSLGQGWISHSVYTTRVSDYRPNLGLVLHF